MKLVGRLRKVLDERGARAVVSGTAGTLVLNSATLVLNFITTVVLSRLLGVTGFGVYAFAVAWSLLLTAFAGLGLSPLVVRNVASATTTSSWGLLRGTLRWANLVVLGSALTTVIIAAAVGFALLDDNDLMLHAFLIALLLITPLSLTTLKLMGVLPRSIP